MPSLRTLPQDLRIFAKYHLKKRVFDYPAQETELGVVPLGFEIDEYLETIRSFAGRFDVQTLAEVTFANRTYPMLCVRSSNRDAEKCVVVLAGVHGNEQAGLLAIPDILDGFAAESVRLVVVTPSNPVGAAELSRYNGDGYDINRDFVSFDTREARAIRSIYDSEQPDFVVSLHEGPQDATFMFANQFVDPDLARRLLDGLERGGTTLATKDYFGFSLRPPGLSPMSRLGWVVSAVWARTLRMKASGMFANDRKMPEITLESSWRLPDRATRVRAHIDLVRTLIRELDA
jgi:hypothetical protein